MWNYSKIFKEAGITLDLEDAVGEEVSQILSAYGIDYNPRIHQFLSKKKRSIEDIASIVSKEDQKDIVAVLSALRSEILERTCQQVRQIYANQFVPYGITEAEFSKLLQSSSSKPSIKYFETELKPLVEKINKAGENGIEVLGNFQLRFHNSIYGTMRSAKDSEHLKSLLAGKVTPQLLQKIFADGQTIGLEKITKILDSNFAPFSKSELLDAAGFSEYRYPLSPERYWPEINSANKDVLDSKILETIDLDSPQIVAETIVSVIKDSTITGVDQHRIRSLFVSKFNKNVNDFLAFIKDSYTRMGYDPAYVDDFISTVKEYIQKSSGKDIRKKDSLFEDHESYFDSIEEREIVDLIRNTFLLQCVASDIRFPKPENFAINKKEFIIDFVIYCDTLSEIKENEIPVIEKQIIIIGEYYGFGGTQIAYAAPQDLYDPDDNLVYSKGTPLTRSQAYEYKTSFKRLTESFCSKAINCKTISIDQARTTDQQKAEVSRGLQANNVIYSPTDKNVEPSRAMQQLIEWYKYADESLREQSKQELSRYIDVDNLQPKPGNEFKETKYSAAIEATKKKIASTELSIAVSQNRNNFNTANIKPGQSSMSYLSKIKSIMKLLRETNKWRYDLLDQINSDINNSKLPISDRNFLTMIAAIQDLSNSPDDIPPINIFRVAFNLKSFFKVA